MTHKLACQSTRKFCSSNMRMPQLWTLGRKKSMGVPRPPKVFWGDQPIHADRMTSGF